MFRDPKLNRFNRKTLTDPPRHVPLSVRLRILLGGFSNQFGWIFFGFGLVFVWGFGGTSALHNAAFFSGDLAVADGIVSSVAETNMTINDRRVYAYHFSYAVGSSNYTGVSKAFGGRYREGQAAPVEYAVDDPARGRIEGLALQERIFWVTALFPLVGLVFMFFGIRKGLRGGRLLRDGKPAVGTFVCKEPTNTRINNQMVYKFTFSFEGDDQRSHEVTAKTHQTELFEGEDGQDFDDNSPAVTEPLLYDPGNPQHAVLLDDLPGSPRIGDTGDIEPCLAAAVPTLLLPAITVGGHLCWALHVLELI